MESPSTGPKSSLLQAAKLTETITHAHSLSSYHLSSFDLSVLLELCSDSVKGHLEVPSCNLVFLTDSENIVYTGHVLDVRSSSSALCENLII